MRTKPVMDFAQREAERKRIEKHEEHVRECHRQRDEYTRHLFPPYIYCFNNEISDGDKFLN